MQHQLNQDPLPSIDAILQDSASDITSNYTPSTPTDTSTPTSRTTSPTPLKMTPPTPITHIVLFKYRSTIPWPTLQSHFSAFAALQTRCLHPSTNAPYILSLRMGANTSWEPFSKGMTHGFVLEFASQAHLDYYLLEDAVHAEFSRGARELVEDSVVVDVRDGEVFAAKAARPREGREGVWRGSCHCGDVGWRVHVPEGEELRHVVCHCDTCKKLGGGPYSCNYIVGENAVVVERGELAVYRYTGASGKGVDCFYCARCTSHVYHRQEALPGKVIVRTLLLEGGNEIEAGGEIFKEGALGWARDLKGALRGLGDV